MADKQNAWPAAAVALGLITLVTSAVLAAILRYATVDDALKIWASFDTIVGVLAGAAGTYFFTKQTTETAKESAKDAVAKVESAHESEIASLAALVSLAGTVEPTKWNDMKTQDPTIMRVLRRDA